MVTEIEELRVLLEDDPYYEKGRPLDGEGRWFVVDHVDTNARRRWYVLQLGYFRNEKSGKIYEFPWDQGLTESQENEYYFDKIREVTRHEELVAGAKVTYKPV